MRQNMIRGFILKTTNICLEYVKMLKNKTLQTSKIVKQNPKTKHNMKIKTIKILITIKEKSLSSL